MKGSHVKVFGDRGDKQFAGDVHDDKLSAKHNKLKGNELERQGNDEMKTENIDSLLEVRTMDKHVLFFGSNVCPVSRLVMHM